MISIYIACLLSICHVLSGAVWIDEQCFHFHSAVVAKGTWRREGNRNCYCGFWSLVHHRSKWPCSDFRKLGCGCWEVLMVVGEEII